MTQFLERLVNQWQLRYVTLALCCGMVFYAVMMPAHSNQTTVVSAAVIDADRPKDESEARLDLPRIQFGQSSREVVTQVAPIRDTTAPVPAFWFQENAEAATLARRVRGLFEEQNPAKDADDLIRRLRERAAKNDSVAQFLLGHAFQIGLGVPRNLTENARLYSLAVDVSRAGNFQNASTPANFNQAFRAFEQAANNGDPVAELYLGLTYEQGDGVTQDTALAVTWFRRAAKHGNVSAACNLGESLLYGEGTAKDTLEAARWLNSAAVRGSSIASYLLGTMYRHGDGVPHDEVTAAKWLGRAAEEGNTAAQVQLSELYATGAGVRGDVATSYMWLNLASVAAPELREFRMEFERLISPADLFHGQKLTHEWLKKHADRNKSREEQLLLTSY